VPKAIDPASGLAVLISVSPDVTTRQVQLASGSGAVATLEATTAMGFFSDAGIKTDNGLQVGTLQIIPAGTAMRTQLRIYEVTGTNPITTTRIASTDLDTGAVRLLDFTAPALPSPNDERGS